MDEAYSLFERNENPVDEWGIEDLFDHLDYLHRVAVALGNLNYQVGNGGFSQWYFNGYADCHYDFLSRLHTEGYTELTEAISLMRKAYVALQKEDEDSHNDRYTDKDEETVADKCDTAFYALKSLEVEMERFLIRLQSNS